MTETGSIGGWSIEATNDPLIVLIIDMGCGLKRDLVALRKKLLSAPGWAFFDARLKTMAYDIFTYISP